jgi:tetratricopeptide (TPR) repeat protein
LSRVPNAAGEPVLRRSLIPAPVVALAAVICLLSPDTFADVDDDLVRVEKQMELLEGKLHLIQAEYLQAVSVRTSSKKFEERLNDGQALMLLKDYVRAAVVFHNLVDERAYRDHVGYADAVFNLGESLFFNKNFIDARKYYRLVLDDPRGRPYRKLAMVRLMQIALRIEDFDQVDEVHERLRKEGGTSSAEGEYLWGKTLFARDRLDGASQAFASLSAGQPFFLQARYFLGVVRVRAGQLEEAFEIFDSLVGAKAKSSKDAEVIELAHLARGRLLHDLGREAEALDAFQAIEHTSPHFDDALYEICWTYVQRAEKAEAPDERSRWFLEAFRTLEILEVSTPDSTFVPRANLLKGHILGKMDRFDDAAEMFAKVSATYASVKQELDELVASHDDPVQYFNEVAGRNLDSFDLSAYLPVVAVKWMSRQGEMSAALGVMKDLETGSKFVAEARALLGKLDTLLADEQDRINLFPVLLEGSKRAIEVDNARVIVERNLSRLEERVVMEYVSASERKGLEQARKDRELLEKKLDDLPTSQTQTANREQRVRRKIETLEQSVYQSTIGLKGMKAQLTAMDEWIRKNGKQLSGREEAVRDFREEIRRGWAMANQLATEKARAGLDAEAQSAEEMLRKRYTEALGSERKLAEQIHDRLGSEGAAQISRINQIRLRSDKVRTELITIKKGLDERVQAEAEKLQDQAAVERKNLDEYEIALAKLEKESENLAGVVAFRALEEVRQKFYRLVLDADVGVLDVAWSRKMQTTRKISDLTRKQGAERKRLHEEFKSVLKEVN